jgi:hypothetical protein
MSTRTFSFPVTAPGNALATAVNSLAVNEWRAFTSSTFPTFGGDSFFREPGGNAGTQGTQPGWVLDYSQIGYRDAARGKIFHIGGSYNSRCYLCTYTEATNAWSRVTLPAAITHTWDQSAYDPTRGLFYIFDQAAMICWTVNVDTHALTPIGAPYTDSQETANVRYFAPSDKVIAYRGRFGAIKTLAGGGSTWSTLGQDASPPDRGGLSSYDHVNNELYVCGGMTQPTSLRKVSATGAVTVLTPTGSPPAFTATSVMLPDPQTGLPVVFMYSGATTVHYWTGATWSSISTWPLTELGNASLFGVALTGFANRSVFMFVNKNNTIYLYRRS